MKLWINLLPSIPTIPTTMRFLRIKFQPNQLLTKTPKKENSNDSGKNENILQNKIRSGLCQQKMMNKSQFYLPNLDQNQILNSGNDGKLIKNQKEFNTASIPNIGNTSNNASQNLSNNPNFISNNNFLRNFQQNFKPNDQKQFIPTISTIPYHVIPYGQFMQQSNQPTIFRISTLTYFPVATHPNYQMITGPIYPQIYANYNVLNANLG